MNFRIRSTSLSYGRWRLRFVTTKWRCNLQKTKCYLLIHWCQKNYSQSKKITVYTHLLAAFFYLEYGLYFASYTRNIPRRTKFSIINSLDETDDILRTDVRNDTHDTDEEDDTYNDLVLYRRTSFYRQRFLRIWTIKLTFITFACKNQCFVVDWSRRVFTGEKVNWPAAYSWIPLILNI